MTATPDVSPGSGEWTLPELLRAWDATRPRSQQTRLGMSELDCRRRVGYRLAGAEPTDPGGTVQAVLGTLIHDRIGWVIEQLVAAGLAPAHWVVEHEVEFAGLLGHVDLYTGDVEDTKTTTDRRLQHVALFGPDEAQWWQVMLYAAGLIAQGRPVRDVVLRFLARDTGRTIELRRPFDAAVVAEALAWVDEVRAAVDAGDVDMLPRDHNPNPQGSFCRSCSFRTRCWDGAIPDRDPLTALYVDDPDAGRWAAELVDARRAAADAQRRIDRAEGALDAVRPDGGGDVRVPGFGHVLRFTEDDGQWRVDLDAVRAVFAAAGVKVPRKRTAGGRGLHLAPAWDSDSSAGNDVAVAR